MSNVPFQGAPPGFFVGTPASRLYRIGTPEYDQYASLAVPGMRPNLWDIASTSPRPRQLPPPYPTGRSPQSPALSALLQDSISMRPSSHHSGSQSGRLRTAEQQRLERELDLLRELQANRERDLHRCLDRGGGGAGGGDTDWTGEDDVGSALSHALRLLQAGGQCSDQGATALRQICDAVGYALVPATDFPSLADKVRKQDTWSAASSETHEVRKDRIVDAALELMLEIGDMKKLIPIFLARATEVLNADVCNLYLLRGDTLVDTTTAQVMPFGGIIGSVITTGKSINTTGPEMHPNFDQRIDSSHVTGYLCTPMFHNGVLKGVARVMRQGYGVKRPFLPAEEQAFASLIGLTAAALQAAGETQALAARAGRSHNDLLMAQQLCNDTLNSGALVRTLVEHAKKLTGATHCSFFLVEVAKGWMFAYHGNAATSCITLDSGIAGHVARSAGILNLADAYNDPRYSPQTDCPTVRPRSMLCASVLYEGKVVAVVQLANKATGDKFGFEDEEALVAYGQFAGSVVHNCHAFEGVQMQRNKAAMVLAMVRPLGVAELIPEKLVALIVENSRQLTGAEKCCLFVMNASSTSLQGFVGVDRKVTLQLGSTSIPGQVAAHGFAVNCARACDHPSYSLAVDRELLGYHEDSIFCAPICADDCVLAVVVLVNKIGDRQFTAEDEDTFAVYANFAGTALRNCRVHDSLKAAKRKNEVLVDVLGKLSVTNLRKVDEIIERIIMGAQELLSSERCSLFMVDKERNELFSRVATNTGGKEIRFRMTQGIAGEVARTQIPLNIRNVYADPRFNSEIDKQLGFKSRSILAFPVVREGETVAVAQLINKTGQEVDVGFTREDEEIMEYFAMFAGITLSNAKMLEFAVASSANAMRLMGHLQHDAGDWRKLSYDAILDGQGQGEHDYKMALATVIPTDDMQRLQQLKLSKEELDAVQRYEFNIHKYKAEENRPRLIPLLVSLFDAFGCLESLGVDRTIFFRFFVRVQMLYRNVPYHNWFHAADVVQTMFLFLRALEPANVFTTLDKYVLLLSGALHDVDHMGLNNSFYLKTETPMGILVNCTGSMSVLEVHHCNLSIEVLSDPETNVFHSLSPDQRTYAFKMLVNIILATDMAKHGEISKSFKELPKLMEDPDREREVHKVQFMKILIKACDVSNVIKPFDVARVWATAVTEEFYTQGDMEKERGFDIAPMFDRQRADLARGQIGFIDFLAALQFGAMRDWFPGFDWACEGLQRTRAVWQGIIDSETKEREQRERLEQQEAVAAATSAPTTIPVVPAGDPAPAD